MSDQKYEIRPPIIGRLSCRESNLRPDDGLRKAATRLAGCDGSGWMEPDRSRPGGPYKCEGCARCQT